MAVRSRAALVLRRGTLHRSRTTPSTVPTPAVETAFAWLQGDWSPESPAARTAPPAPHRWVEDRGRAPPGHTTRTAGSEPSFRSVHTRHLGSRSHRRTPPAH